MLRLTCRAFADADAEGDRRLLSGTAGTLGEGVGLDRGRSGPGGFGGNHPVPIHVYCLVVKKLLLDCDPGIDDALALALAAGSPEIDLVGITTVGGNVNLDLTTANALALREFYRIDDVPVTPGSAQALLGVGVRAESVHGATGLGGVTLPAPVNGIADGHAVDFIIETLRSAPGEITLVAVGPLTNIALAVRREPRIVEWVRDFVIMGGSYTRGNHTPAAEFNIKADPEAAAIVFGAGWNVTMVGLDVTLTAVVTESILDQMRSLGRLADLVVPISQFYGVVEADGGPAIHDAVAVAHVIDPSLLKVVPAVVNVETVGTYTSGMTVTDFQLDGKVPNASVAVELDVDRFWKLVMEAYGRLAAAIA